MNILALCNNNAVAVIESMFLAVRRGNISGDLIVGQPLGY